MKIMPCTYKTAAEYVNKHHRHHNASIGCKFCISVVDNQKSLCGVAICGRPVSRYLDNGETLEINRVCTDGSKNACSMLYGACCRIAKAMGYKKVITYTLISEDGASLRASNFVCDGEAGGKHWTGERNRPSNVPREKKIRWHYDLTKFQSTPSVWRATKK